MSDDDETPDDQIMFDVVWNYLHRGRNWYACVGFILDVMGHLALAADKVEESFATAESIMRVVEDRDGQFLAKFKRLYLNNPEQAVKRWREDIEPGLIDLWEARARCEDLKAKQQGGNPDAPAG